MFFLVDLNITYRPKTAIFFEFSIKKNQFPAPIFPGSPPPLSPLPAPSIPASRPLHPRFRTLHPRFRVLHPRTPAPPVHPLMSRLLFLLAAANGQFQRNLSFSRLQMGSNFFQGVQLIPGGVQLLIPYRNPYNL